MCAVFFGKNDAKGGRFNPWDEKASSALPTPWPLPACLFTGTHLECTEILLARWKRSHYGSNPESPEINTTNQIMPKAGEYATLVVRTGVLCMYKNTRQLIATQPSRGSVSFCLIERERRVGVILRHTPTAADSSRNPLLHGFMDANTPALLLQPPSEGFSTTVNRWRWLVSYTQVACSPHGARVNHTTACGVLYPGNKAPLLYAISTTTTIPRHHADLSAR